MFTWICPKCGSEVPPSLNECPKCVPERTYTVWRPSATSAQPETAPPPVQPPAPPPEPPPVRRVERKVSPAFVAIAAAAGIVVVLGILYLYVLPRSGPASSAPAVSLQAPGGPGSSRSAHPLAKHLELAGIRVTRSAEQTARIQLLVINHSAADLPDLKMQVTLRGASGGNPVFEFPIDLPSIGPYESRDITSTVRTTLKAYEIPDWQLLRAEFRLASEP